MKKKLSLFFLGHPVCISIPHLLKRPGLDPLRQTTQFCSFNIHLETMCESFLLHNPLSPKSLILRCKPKDNYIFASPIPTYLVIFTVYLVTNYKFICHDQDICMKNEELNLEVKEMPCSVDVGCYYIHQRVHVCIFVPVIC